MNGYKVLADSYRKLMEQGKVEQETAQKEIRILDFLATCDKDDIYRLFNSSAFNDITKAYCKKAMESVGVEQEQKENVMAELSALFSDVLASEIMK